jgi:hypothetical protein
MEGIAMRRILAFSVGLGLILTVLFVAPVSAGTRTNVTMTVTTIFDPDPDAFVATGIPGCASGVVYDGGANVRLTRALGMFAGYKVFDCGDDNGFVVFLSARFGPGGSVGTWSVVDAWGSAAGMSGSGKLIGDPIETGGITDNYFGTVTF